VHERVARLDEDDVGDVVEGLGGRDAAVSPADDGDGRGHETPIGLSLFPGGTLVA
jgi:hypothetical protein